MPTVPLIFDSVIEVLAVMVRQRKEIKGIEKVGRAHKLLYADDIVFAMQDALNSAQVLTWILVVFGEIAVYKINDTKSVLIDLKIGKEDKDQITKVIKAPRKIVLGI